MPEPTSDWSPPERTKLAEQEKFPLVVPNVPGSEPLARAPAGTTVETLLRPTPTPDGALDTYVYFGTLRVARELVDDFKRAEQFLAKDPEAVDALYALEHTPRYGVTIDKVNDRNDRFIHEENTIYWDPTTAVLNGDGSRYAPALGLLHEQGHAVEFNSNPARYQENVSRRTQHYDNAEEERNITGLEDRARRYLPGEGHRTDHGGVAYTTAGPTDTAPSPGHALSDPEIVKAFIHGERFALKLHGYSPPPVCVSVTPWHNEARTGAVLHLDAHTIAQHVGRGAYVIFDIQKDLHGVVPPENDPSVHIDAAGRVSDSRHSAHVQGVPGR